MRKHQKLGLLLRTRRGQRRTAWPDVGSPMEGTLASTCSRQAHSSSQAPTQWVRPTESPVSGSSLGLSDLDCLLSLHQLEHLKHTELDLSVGVGAWQWFNRLDVELVGWFKALLFTPSQYDL